MFRNTFVFPGPFGRHCKRVVFKVHPHPIHIIQPRLTNKTEKTTYNSLPPLPSLSLNSSYPSVLLRRAAYLTLPYKRFQD